MLSIFYFWTKAVEPNYNEISGDPNEDYTEELENLREQCFAADPKARKIWR